MSIIAQDVRTPAGRIPRELFPELDSDALDDQLTTWITEGEEKAAADAIDAGSVDTAVRQWTYHRAFDAAYVAALNTPMTSATQDVGSRSFTMQQLTSLRTLSEQALGLYMALVPAASSTPVQRNASVSVINTFRF